MAIEDIFNNQGMSSPNQGFGGAVSGAGKLIDKGVNFFSGAFDKFKSIRDSRSKDAPKNYSDEVNQMLNIDNFSPDEDDKSALANIQRISLNEPTIEVTQADVNRGGGLGQAGNVSVAGIGAMPIYVAKGSTLPLSLMEKRKEALRKVAEKKNTALKDFLEMPEGADPMYDRQLTDVMINIADETASYKGIDMTDISDSRVQDLMKKKARAESLYRVMDKEDGVIAKARAIMDEVKKSGGEYIMDTKAYKDAQDLLLGRYSAEDLINEPDAYKSFLDVAGRIESESSAVDIFKTVVKGQIEQDVSSWIKENDIATKLEQGIEIGTLKQTQEDRINSYIDGVAEDQGWSSTRVKQIKKISKASFGRQLEKTFGTIKTTSAQLEQMKKKAEEEMYDLKPDSDDRGNTYYSYNTADYIEDGTIDSKYSMIKKNGKMVPLPSGLGLKGTTGNTTSYTDSQLISDFGQLMNGENGTELTKLMSELSFASSAVENAEEGTDEYNNAKSDYETKLAQYSMAADKLITDGFDQRFKDRNFTKVTLTAPYFQDNQTLKDYDALITEQESLETLVEAGDNEAEKTYKDIEDQLKGMEAGNRYFPAGTVMEVPTSSVRGLESKLKNLNSRRGYTSKEEFFRAALKSISPEQYNNLKSYLHEDYLKSMGVDASRFEKTDKQSEQTKKKDVPSGEVEKSKAVKGKSGKTWQAR